MSEETYGTRGLPGKQTVFRLIHITTKDNPSVRDIIPPDAAIGALVIVIEPTDGLFQSVRFSQDVLGALHTDEANHHGTLLKIDVLGGPGLTPA